MTVADIYQQYLGRDGSQDTAGIAYWQDQVDKGLFTIEQTEQMIKESPEAIQYQATQPDPTPPPTANPVPTPPTYTQASVDTIIKYTYANVLGRPAKQEALDYWSDSLQSGKLDASNFQSTFESAARENGETLLSDIALVQSIYTNGLGKEATQEDIDYWTSQLSSGEVNPSNITEAIGAVATEEGQTFDSAKVQQQIRDDYNSQALGYDVSMTDPFEFKPVDFNAQGYDPNAKFIFNEDDPSYQFRLHEGVKALDASASSRGMLLSGAQQNAVQQYGQDLASQEYQNAYARYTTDETNKFNLTQGAIQASGNQDLTKYNTQQNALLNVANLGVGAAGQIQSAGNVLGSQVSNSLTSTGQAQAAGYIGSGAATASGYAGAATAVNQGLENNLLYNYTRN